MLFCKFLIPKSVVKSVSGNTSKVEFPLIIGSKQHKNMVFVDQMIPKSYVKQRQSGAKPKSSFFENMKSD